MRHAYCFVAVIISLCVLMLSGCARLSVRVDILNSAFWVSPQYVDSVTLAKIVGMEQAILDGRFTNWREEYKADVKQTLVEISKEPLPAGLNVRRIEPSPQNIEALANGFNKNAIDPYYNAARGFFEKAYVETSTAGKATSDAKTHYRNGMETLAQLSREVTKAIQRTIQSSLPNDPEYWDSKALQNLERKSGEGLIGGAEILEDPHAAAVVYAPKEYWTGPPYNRTLCTGSFGSTDCAVKMDGLGDFTLKGVRLDASKITQATFSVAREAIQVVGAVYGIPVPKSQPTQATQGGQGSDNQALGEITSPVKRQRDAETAILQFRLARIAMFETIVAQRQAIIGDNQDTREKAIAAIKPVLKANREQLVPSPAQ